MELVVGASEATMSSLLSKLGGLLAHEYALIRRVRGDIQYINDEMASMQAFLGDLSSAAAPQGHDRRLKDWMKQIRDVTYDIEDCVDDFAHRLSHDPGGDVCCAFVVSNVYELWTWRPRRNIASSIAELKVRAQQIGERRIRYGVENPKNGGGHHGGHATGFQAAENQQTRLEIVGTKKPVGVEDDMKELGVWVSLQQQQPVAATSPHGPSSSSSQAEAKMPGQGVLSIVGFGGVGKTTIASALYQNFGDQFDCRAKVTVSQSSDIEAIVRIILDQVHPQYKNSNGRTGSRGGGTSEKNRLMASIGNLWDTVVPKGHKEDVQRGGSTSEMTQALKRHLEGQRYIIFSNCV
jgi:disease resistance protein RPM1